MAKNERKDRKDLVYYMALPYTILLRPDGEGDYIARIDELPGCTAHGPDRNEALECLQAAQQAWMEDCLASGDPIPEPEPEEELPSGKWVQRVPRSLHGKLAKRAKKEEVSLNQLVTSMLSESLATRAFRYEVEHKAISSATHWHENDAFARAGDWVCEPKLDINSVMKTLKHAKGLVSEAGVKIDDYRPQTTTEEAYS